MRYFGILLALLPVFTFAADPTNKGPELIRTLHEGNNFKPDADKTAWQQRARYLREQVLISAGLWPMPDKCPLNAVIHGRIDREDYTIEKVYFESYPGFYVTGNLYRPKGKSGRFPAVLSPHGHWTNGRLYEAPEKEVKKQLEGGWERDEEAARYPMQARCASLARLGCIVFFYDMVGYADADTVNFPHRTTYRDIDSDLHGLSVFGLQTWDSIRSIDFLESLPDVDRKRIAITGASGGASQTIMMMATDDRIAVAAPVNMISAGEHQGGCVCENNSLLRIGTDNVELAATFAPKPFIHPTATGDWTKDFLEKGFPEVQATYKLFGAEANVESMRQTAPHNYNLHAREAVYNFFNKHLKLGHEGIVIEQKFTPVKPKDLSVWDAEHPRPKNSVDAAGLKTWWVEMTGKQIEALKPKDRVGIETASRVLRPVLSHLIGPNSDHLSPAIQGGEQSVSNGVFEFTLSLDAGGKRQLRPLVFTKDGVKGGLFGDSKAPPSVLLLLPGGTAAARMQNKKPIDLIQALLDANRTVIVPDLFEGYTIPQPTPDGKPTDEFFSGYNYTIQGRQVRDLLTTMDRESNTKFDLVSVGEMAPVVLLARSAAPNRIHRAVIDAAVIGSSSPHSERDAQFLPHALRYAGIWPLASLGGTTPLMIHGLLENQEVTWMTATFTAAGAAEELHVDRKSLQPEKLVEFLNR